jgi:sulfide:quinone oxidoreductase
MARVLILGGGFGGIATAVALRDRLPSTHEVVLVERQATFTMGLRKNWGVVGAEQLAAGSRSLDRLVRRGIEVVRGTITAIHPGDRAAEVDGRRLTGDAVVVALGADRDTGHIPGFGEHAIDVYDLAQNGRAANAIATFRGGRLGVGIFGAPYPCPPAPYELALLIADRFDRLGVTATIEAFTTLPRSIPILGQAGCDAFDARLTAAGIEFLPGRQATAVDADGVQFGEERRAYDLLLGVPPHRVPQVVADSGLTAGGQWVPVDRHTLETAHAGVYAIGDVTAIPLANGMALPKAGVFAHAEGDVVAARIAAALAGEQPDATFAGDGACFLETGGGTAAMVRGGFLDDPPSVEMSRPNEATLAAKHAFETDRLTAWFGG